LSDERVDLEADEGKLHVTCGRNEARINGIPAQEFPTLPALDTEFETVLKIAPDVLSQALSSVVAAAATDESRPVLTGVLFALEDDVLTLSAADGFRLAVRKLRVSEPAAKPFKAIIPATALKELIRLLSDEEEDAVLYYSPKRDQMWFMLQGWNVYGTVNLVTSTIVGTFISYAKIIPTSHTTQITADRTKLLRALKRARIFARNEANVLDLTICENGSGPELVLRAESTEMGNFEERLDVQREGEDFHAAFNVAMLMDGLAAMGSELAVFEGTQPSRPGVLRPEDGEDYIYVQMPMHVRGEK
jgi:DNA polymerase-3 subunit beta